MRRLVIAAIVTAIATLPAAAQLGTFRTIATTFCDAVLTGRMAPLLAILTEDLRRLAGPGAEVPVFWQGRSEPPETCMPVGNAGTRDRPETVISFGYLGAGRPGYAQTLVMVFVDGELRIDDVRFADGTTLRERLAVRA